MRPFTLLQRRLALRQLPAAGSTLLAYIFETALVFPSARSASHSRPRPAFFRPAGRDHCESPVANLQFQNSPPAFRPPLPSRTSPSFGIPALCLVAREKTYHSELPDLRLLPVTFVITNYHAALRINAPAPLLPAWLTVPRTSWNHGHDAPGAREGQGKRRLLLRLNWHFYQPVTNTFCGIRVDKTILFRRVRAASYGVTKRRIIPVSVAIHKCSGSGAANTTLRATAR